MLGRKDCQVANSRSTGPRQQNTDDRNCSDANAERSTSADWRTADADYQKRQWWVCSCSPGTAEPFHEETGTTSLNCTQPVTPSQWSSSCSSRDKPLILAVANADGKLLISSQPCCPGVKEVNLLGLCV